MKYNRAKILLLLSIVITCTSCDLFTKWLAARHLKWSPPKTIINHLVELRYTENEAIAFSMLGSIHPGTRKWLIYSLSGVALIFLVLLIWQVRKDSIWWLIALMLIFSGAIGNLAERALMLIFSGAIGNLAERVMRGYVIDFIHIHYYDRFSWPIFNVADILITCGGIFLAILMLRKNPQAVEI